MPVRIDSSDLHREQQTKSSRAIGSNVFFRAAIEAGCERWLWIGTPISAFTLPLSHACRENLIPIAS
jgi:hypothetical protein